MPDSLLLALNAAEARLQLVLAGLEPAGAGNGFLAAQEWHAPSQGAELLTPALRQMLARLGRRPEHIRRIACVRGPGSFTGLRLAVSSAAGLARATGASQAGLDYLPLLAWQAYALSLAASARQGALWVLTHARRNLVHAQGFRVDPKEGAVHSLGPATALPLLPEKEPPEVSAAPYIHALSQGLPLMLSGSGRTRNLAVTRKLFPKALHLPESLDHPLPAALLHAARAASYARTDIVPLYIRASDAEENLSLIAAKLGLDPEHARRRLHYLTSEFTPHRLT